MFLAGEVVIGENEPHQIWQMITTQSVSFGSYSACLLLQIVCHHKRRKPARSGAIAVGIVTTLIVVVAWIPFILIIFGYSLEAGKERWLTLVEGIVALIGVPAAV